MSYKSIGTAVVYDPFYVQVTIIGHGYSTGSIIEIEEVVGMTDLNNVFTVDTIINANNFLVPLATAQTYTSGGKSYTMGSSVYKVLVPSYTGSHGTDTWNPLQRKMLADIGYVDNFYTKKIIECPIQTTFTPVVENFIDLENRTSKIIQESY
jgi:hypothetical protein